MWNRLRTGSARRNRLYPGEEPWRTRARAHDIAEEGLDKLIEGDTETGEQLIDKVANRSEAIEELAEGGKTPQRKRGAVRR
jgi:aldehyde:ferredoxin oxidoreductase